MTKRKEHGTIGYCFTGQPRGSVAALWSAKLPLYDYIPSLILEPGMYCLDRWPAEAEKQVEFLQQVMAMWGKSAKVHLVEPDDGYPGYIHVKK